MIVHHVEPRGIPVVAGLCRYCLREMWAGTHRPGGRGLLPAAASHPGACTTCAAYMTQFPDRDPRDVRGAAAERLPSERAESAPGWRDHPGRRCIGVPAGVFEPEPEPDEDSPELRSLRDAARQEAARTLCAACPVAEACRAAAEERAYEGLWGGWLFTPDGACDLVSDQHSADEVAA